MYSAMNTAMNITFSQWVQNNLDDRNWSQAELARRAGITRGAVSNIVNNQRNRPDPDTVKAIARAFGKSEEEALQIAGYLSPKPDFDPEIAELNALWEKLTPEQQQMGMELFRRLVAQQEERERRRQQKKTTGPLTEP